MHLDTILNLALDGTRPLTREERIFLLDRRTAEECGDLYHAAYELKKRTVGTRVSLRGLIEISNICTKNCYYCGIRRDIAQHRYQLSLEDIVEGAAQADRCRYGSIVLQGGEREDAAFADFIEAAVRAVKARFDLGITLSLGEQPKEYYQRFFAAGAHRYLLRIESSDLDFYRTLHPADHDWHRRLACIRTLREVGFQTGSGVMIGLPGQTLEHLAQDLAFFEAFDLDMIGMGPYIAHAKTPLGLAHPQSEADKMDNLRLGLNMIAVTRLVLRDVNIASTTALQTLAPDGRERGLLAGANVIMPNVGAVIHRSEYQLYEGKPGMDENSEISRVKLEAAIHGIGETIAYDQYGDSPHFFARKGR